MDINISSGSVSIFLLNAKAYPVMDIISKGVSIKFFRSAERKLDLQISLPDTLMHYLTFNPRSLELKQVSAMNPNVKKHI